MKRDILYSLVLLLSVFIFAACGTDSKSNPVAVSEYSFVNATTPLLVTEATTVIDINGSSTTKDSYIIAVQLLRHGLIELGQEVQMKSFPFAFGFVTDIITVTTTNGYAVFDYHVPEDYASVKGQEFVIQAIFIDPKDNNTSGNGAPKITLTQDFLIKFQ